MSRSIKKNPVVKDQDKWFRAYSHRVVRRRTKQAIHGDDEMPLLREGVNQYTVSDYTFRASKKDSFYDKFKRK